MQTTRYRHEGTSRMTGWSLLRLAAGVWLALFVLRASAQADDLTPQQQAELKQKSAELENRAVALYGQGKYAGAMHSAERALAMKQQLYPPARYPAGHPDLARSLNNLGSLLDSRGEYARALPYYERALAMNEQLYP